MNSRIEAFSKGRSGQDPAPARSRTALREAVYGGTHPYVSDGYDSVTMGASDLNGWRERWYNPTNAVLVVTGRFELDRIEAKIRAAFGPWQGKATRSAVPAVSPRKTSAAIGLVAGGRATVEVSIGYLGGTGWDENEAARRVLTEMLDDGMRAVRDELAASYGVHAAYHRRVGRGMYDIRGDLEPTRAGEALRLMRARIADVRNGKKIAASFVRARRSVLRELLVDAGDSGQTADDLSHIAHYDRTKDDWMALANAVANLSPQAVVRLAAVELSPEKEVVVGMGDRAALDKMFAASELKPTYQEETKK